MTGPPLPTPRQRFRCRQATPGMVRSTDETDPRRRIRPSRLGDPRPHRRLPRPDAGAALEQRPGNVRIDPRHDAPYRRRRCLLPVRAHAVVGGRSSRRTRWTWPRSEARWNSDGAAWSEFLAADLDPDVIVVRHREDGSESHAPLGIRLAQVVHHGTDHRSQICTALTNLGIEPPAIDVWDFAWQQGRLTETGPTS